MRLWKWPVAAATVVLIVVALQLASVDHAVVAAPLLLLDVVVVARLFGFGPALLAAGFGAAAYSYFFLPPEGFGLESPDDWIAFGRVRPLDERLASIRAVTAADVQRVAQRWLVPDGRSVVQLVPPQKEKR